MSSAKQAVVINQPSHTLKKNDGHIGFLDHTRGVAILAVMLFHTLGVTFGHDALPWQGWFRDFSQREFLAFLPFSLGGAGVAIFFVVSGFCIHLSFQSSGRNWAAFFIRRTFRIYPAYLAALLFCVGLSAMHTLPDFTNPENWKDWLLHALLLHNFSGETFFGINPSFWSLAVEAQLYLLYPGLLWLVVRGGWGRALCLLAAGEIIIRATMGVMAVKAFGNAGVMSTVDFLSRSPLGYWFSWSIGAWIAEAYLQGQSPPDFKLPPVVWAGLAVGCEFIKPLEPFFFPCAALATAAIICRSIVSEKQMKPTGSGRWLAVVGIWSYSLYLLHQPLLNLFSYPLSEYLSEESRQQGAVVFPLFVLTWAIIALLSWLWFELFEGPGIRLGQRLAGQHKPGNKAPAETSSATGSHANKLNPQWMKWAGLIGLAGVIFYISHRFTPLDPAEKNNLAWKFATDPDPARRDGLRAVKLAEEACAQTGHTNIVMIGTLAAAYAEAGRFEDAITTGETAAELAAQQGNSDLQKRNQTLLELYQQRQPYHQTSSTSAAAP
jgi:peptidoglycan/LPS O-acetylase OafA/YrhL